MGRLKQYWRPVAFALGGTLAVWAASLSIPDRYISIAVVRVNVERFPDEDLINHVYQEMISRSLLRGLIVRLNLYPEERERLPLEDVLEAAQKDDIKLDILPDQTIQISFEYPDPSVAQTVVNALIDIMIKSAEDLASREPGWNRLALRQAAGPAKANFRLAVRHPARYISQGTLAVKAHAAPVGIERAERRAECLKQKLLSKNVPEHLRIDRTRNLLLLHVTAPDAQDAQKQAASVAMQVIDANVLVSDCESTETEQASPGSFGVGTMFQSIEGETIHPDPSNGMSPDLLPTTETLGLPQSPLPPGPPSSTASARPGSVFEELGGVILSPGTLPQGPDGPSRPILSLFGFFLGLGLWTAVKD